MDRQYSYNWLKEYVKLSISAEVFAREFSLKSQTIDRITDLSPQFSGVITAKILEVTKHPNADKLRLATVDTGKEKMTVVCGAPNIAAGQIVPLAPVGAKVLDPDGNQWQVTKAKIRNVESNGMLCSQKELGIGEDHAGIMILPPGTAVGKPLAAVLSLDDKIFEIEITSNRPDVMSVVGLAREAAAVFGAKFTYQPPKPSLVIKEKLPLSVKIQEPKFCSRYQGVVMTGVKVGPSPLWLQLRLIQAGLRPINNVVDITNYVLLELGKPIHVFDYHKLTGGQIIVRKAKPGEKILALDGKTYELKPNHLVIADQKIPVAVAGIMGGQDSAATESTTTIVFESATFDPVAIRKTSRELNLHSDSSDLFEKGINSQSVEPAILRAIELTQQLAGGKVASEIVDVRYDKYQVAKISFDVASIPRHLGVEIPVLMIKKILVSLGFAVSGGKKLSLTIPWWRQGDVVAEHDVIEEVARIYGYHNLPTELPSGQIPLRPKNQLFFWENQVKDILAGLGFTEVYNYSMLSPELLKKVDFSTEQAVKIYNPLNETMEYMRTTQLSQILQNVADNLNNFSEIKIFELSNIYLVQKVTDLPDELPKLTGAVVGENAFFQVKGVIEFLLKKLLVADYEFKLTDQKCPLWQSGQALDILVDKKFIGQFGLASRKILSQFDIKKPVTVFDFDFSALITFAATTKKFQPLPEFPGVERDLAMVVEKNLTWQKISASTKGVDKLIVAVDYLNTFTDQSFGENKKSLAFRLGFRSTERTLKSEEVDAIVKKVINDLEKNFGAKLR